MGLPLIPGTTTITPLGMCYTEKHKYYSNISQYDTAITLLQ